MGLRNSSSSHNKSVKLQENLNVDKYLLKIVAKVQF